ncbi:MAG: homogentisate 1,2-dioxygenase [Caulobacteraceae bacterium]|nr:homogentisate 1,2-dioxygenase [Caulobacteraceae bacterium]
MARGFYFRLGLAALALGAALSSGAQAQTPTPAPVCATGDKALPPEFSAWAHKSDLAAAKGPADLPRASLVPGQAVTLTLTPTPRVTYLAQPEKPGGSVSHGGLASLTIDRAGSYRIALDGGAWIDLLKDGKALVSTGHGHGPDCSGIRKIVDFDLAPGLYVLQISANAGPTLAVLVTPRPVGD